MQQLLEKISRYWQLRAVVIGIGVVLIGYALVMPVHSDESAKLANSDQAPVTSVMNVKSSVTPPAMVGDNNSTPTHTVLASDLPATGWLAQNPEAAAQFSLVASSFEDGRLPLDFSESVRQLQRGAEQGDPTAEYLLGHAYESGLGLPRDMTETSRWYLKAAAASRAADASSSQPPPKNFADAFEAYHRLAEQGNADAQLYTGLAYDLGQDVPRSAVEAARWYRKAAAQGSYSAQNNLGVLYHNGDGIPKDDSEAAAWFSRAASKGSAVAQFNLGRMYYAGDGVPRDYGQAALWLDKAAMQGSAPAQVLLSTMYASGQGVNGDIATAYMWLNLASATERQARISRDKIEKIVPPDQIAEGQRLTRAWISQHPRILP